MGVHQARPTRQRPSVSHFNMLIEEEADAVFNEIRNMKEILSLSESNKERKSVSPTPIITINVNVLSSPEEQQADKSQNNLTSPSSQEDGERSGSVGGYAELEEPVSPPSCHPDEGPPLLFSQSIEDLAAVIVKEKRQKDKKEPVEDVEKKPSQTSPPPK